MSNQQHAPEPVALIHAAWLGKSLTIGAQEAADELRRLHTVEKQRDQLLAALRSARESLVLEGYEGGPTMQEIDDAIKEAEGA